MLKPRILGTFAIVALATAIAATTAVNASTPSSPAEKAATADLNKKIVNDNAAVDAQEKAKQEAYQQEVRRQQAQYEEQKRAYEQQLAQYEQQIKNIAPAAPAP
jgi:uncharacterized membrane protein